MSCSSSSLQPCISASAATCGSLAINSAAGRLPAQCPHRPFDRRFTHTHALAGGSGRGAEHGVFAVKTLLREPEAVPISGFEYPDFGFNFKAPLFQDQA